MRHGAWTTQCDTLFEHGAHQIYEHLQVRSTLLLVCWRLTRLRGLCLCGILFVGSVSADSAAGCCPYQSMLASHMTCNAPDSGSSNAALGVGHTTNKRKTNDGQDENYFTHENPSLIKRKFQGIHSRILPAKMPTQRHPDSLADCSADPTSASKDLDICRLPSVVHQRN